MRQAIRRTRHMTRSSKPQDHKESQDDSGAWEPPGELISRGLQPCAPGRVCSGAHKGRFHSPTTPCLPGDATPQAKNAPRLRTELEINTRQLGNLTDHDLPAPRPAPCL